LGVNEHHALICDWLAVRQGNRLHIFHKFRPSPLLKA
jgi:hypothetical protein